MAQKLFSTGPGVFRSVEQKEIIDGLDRTSCDSLSVGSYEQAAEVSRMELEKGPEDLYRKEPSGHSSYGFPKTATLGL